MATKQHVTVLEGGFAVSESVASQNWHDAIRFVIDRSLPDPDFAVVNFHQSRSSESMYVNLLAQGRLYQLRYAFHDHDDHNPQLRSFNLRPYPHDRLLIQDTKKFLRNSNGGSELTYFHFAALTLVEKLTQENPSPVLLQDDSFILHGHIATDHLQAELDFLLQHQLLLCRFKTGEIFLSQSGQKLLDFYWDVADSHIDEQVWDENPRIATPRRLLELLA